MSYRLKSEGGTALAEKQKETGAAWLAGDLNWGHGNTIKMSPAELLPFLTCLFNGNESDLKVTKGNTGL